jgi:hypothetical protein
VRGTEKAVLYPSPGRAFLDGAPSPFRRGTLGTHNSDFEIELKPAGPVILMQMVLSLDHAESLVSSRIPESSMKLKKTMPATSLALPNLVGMAQK